MIFPHLPTETRPRMIERKFKPASFTVANPKVLLRKSRKLISTAYLFLAPTTTDITFLGMCLVVDVLGVDAILGEIF
jgi:hypothetical protein